MDGRNMRGARTKRVLLILVAAVLFIGLFLQISMLARISGQNKQASRVEAEITRLSSDAENLELVINKYHNLEDIAAKAAKLGMERPGEEQIRVVSVAGIVQDAAVQTAERIGEGEVLN